jgi:hypothetical protein
MEELLKTPFWKNLIVWIFILLLCVIGITRFFLLPYFFSVQISQPIVIFSSILDNLFSSIFASAVAIFLISYLTPLKLTKANMDIVPAGLIGKEFQDALMDSDFWWYMGGCGRFQRSDTIPLLIEQSRRSNKSKDIYIMILDVDNDTLCQQYANYRNSLNSARKGKGWDKERVKTEIYTTIVASYALVADNTLVNVTVALQNSFSLFRVDLSQSRAIVTKEEKTEPALKCDSGTVFYDSYRENLKLHLQQCKTLTNLKSRENVNNLTIPGVRDLLNSLGVETSSLDDAKVHEIIEAVKNAKNPYG